METDNKEIESPMKDFMEDNAFTHWRKEYLEDWLPEYEDDDESYRT